MALVMTAELCTGPAAFSWSTARQGQPSFRCETGHKTLPQCGAHCWDAGSRRIPWTRQRRTARC